MINMYWVVKSRIRSFRRSYHREVFDMMILHVFMILPSDGTRLGIRLGVLIMMNSILYDDSDAMVTWKIDIWWGCMMFVMIMNELLIQKATFSNYKPQNTSCQLKTSRNVRVNSVGYTIITPHIWLTFLVYGVGFLSYIQLRRSCRSLYMQGTWCGALYCYSRKQEINWCYQYQPKYQQC